MVPQGQTRSSSLQQHPTGRALHTSPAYICVLKPIFTFSASWKRYTKWIKTTPLKRERSTFLPSISVLTPSVQQNQSSVHKYVRWRVVSFKNIAPTRWCFLTLGGCPACLCTCGHGYWWRAQSNVYWGSMSHSKHTPRPQRSASPCAMLLAFSTISGGQTPQHWGQTPPTETLSLGQMLWRTAEI